MSSSRLFSPLGLLITSLSAGLFSILLPLPALLGGTLTILYGASTSLLAGPLFSKHESRGSTMLLGALGTWCSLTLGGTALFYFFTLNPFTLTPLLIGVPILWYALLQKKRSVSLTLTPHTDPSPRFDFSRHEKLSFVIIAALFLAAWITIFSARTSLALRTPWDAIPPYFFAILFLLAYGVLSLANRKKRIALGATSLFFFLTISIATFIYSVGFGFDAFIHQATETTIFTTGTIAPKPLYYIGQYSILILLSLMTKLSVVSIDTLFLPILTLLLIPIAYRLLKKSFPHRSALITLPALLLIPFSSFIVTTPQGVANVFAGLTFLLIFTSATQPGLEKQPHALLILLAFTTLAIHPIAGIPTLFASFLYVLQTNDRFSQTAHAPLTIRLLTFFGAISLPLLFAINALVSRAQITLANPFTTLSSSPQIISRRLQLFLDTVYFWKSIQLSVIFLIALLAFLSLRKQFPQIKIFFQTALIVLGNYLILKYLIRFPFLLFYEQTNYADRFKDIALLLALPLFLAGMSVVFEKLQINKTPILRFATTTLMAILVTATTYLSYPRRDPYDTSRGWSTSAADVSAVRLIAQDAKNRPYIVLANQQVSAAAIREYGFPAYYPSQNPSVPGPIFYYPVPTGDALYQYFLNMNSDRGAATVARQAMDLTGVDTVYYVVDNYWYKAQEISLNAKKESEKNWNVENQVFVFKYTR